MKTTAKSKTVVIGDDLEIELDFGEYERVENATVHVRTTPDGDLVSFQDLGIEQIERVANALSRLRSEHHDDYRWACADHGYHEYASGTRRGCPGCGPLLPESEEVA